MTHYEEGASTASVEELHETLTSAFGMASFREGQEAVVTRLAAGKSVVAIFPTGGGKSLCYQLPALLFDGLTLVISPLIALMKDQLEFLHARGIAAGRLDSSLTREENLQLFDDLRSGELKLLYISPERLANERFLQTLRRQKIALLAIDEAHCISEWGHNFRPDYLKIASLAAELNVGRVLALTATATPSVAKDVAAAFDILPEDVINTGFYRANLALHVTPCRAGERDALLLDRLSSRPAGPAIVYVTLQKTAVKVASFLTENGFPAQAYHAGMKPEDRNAVQDEFMASAHGVIVATIAFGMGLDKADIRYIYHYNLPKSLESYSQEVGRAGRDGEASICELFACASDVVVLENFVYGDTPEPSAVAALTQYVLSLGDTFSVAVYSLSADYDMRTLVVKTLLTYLELDGVIESTGPFYTGYKFKAIRSSAEIFARVGEERAEFLRSVFRFAKKGRTWLSLDTEEVSQAIGEPRDRIVAALTYLDEVGDLEVQASGVREGYRLRALPDDPDALAEELAARFHKREENDLARVGQVLAFAQHDACLTAYLLQYFGEERPPCGHCCRCEGHADQALPPARRGSPDEVDAGRLRRVVAEAGDALQSPRQCARFLCGITSPGATRAKLNGHPLFGSLASVPFLEVLAHLDAEG